ncbi:MAG: response regulator [Bradymonadaceae bacterium]|nr:response regulator [Lujinxingiaceae bacterium]
MLDQDEAPQLSSQPWDIANEITIVRSWNRWLTRLLGRAPRIVVAEDEAPILESIVSWFNYAGFEVHGVSDGSELCTILEPLLCADQRGWGPDILLSDLRMPGIDALGVVEGLRYAGHRLPIVVVSACTDPLIWARVTRLQDTVFVAKPFDVMKLHEIACQAIVRVRSNPDSPPFPAPLPLVL